MVIKARKQVLGQVRIGRRGARPADLAEQLLSARDGRRPFWLSYLCAICMSRRSFRERRLRPSPSCTAGRALPRPAKRTGQSPGTLKRRVC